MENQNVINQEEIIDPKKEKISNLSWYLFIGCMFIGMGIGMIFNHTDTGLLIGMGVGFISSAAMEYKKG